MRNLVLGRCAGILFLAGGLAAVPANALLKDPIPDTRVHYLNALVALSGLICLLVPWGRVRARWLHALPPLGIAQIALSAIALRTHGEIYLWFLTVIAVFIGYAFRRRLHVAAHMAFAAAALAAVGVTALGHDPDALPRTVMATLAISVTAGVVVWLRENLERRERTDPLTGLANRLALIEALEAIDRPTTLALYDLDGFKRYNDRLGHQAGDQLLERLSARLDRAVRGHGTAYRLGGDELCVLIDDPTLLGACDAALREGEITASHGSALLPLEARTPSAALSLVDVRMYADKRAGRGVGFVSPMPAAESPRASTGASAPAAVTVRMALGQRPR